MSLRVVHVELAEANDFVIRHHRHHKKVQGHRFSIGVLARKPRRRVGVLVGVAIVGRPVARAVDPRTVVEVTRLCTDGTKNACSFLYAASARAARELGYAKIQTYILDEETGVSLLAAGWVFEDTVKGRSWDTPSRRREDKIEAQFSDKARWAKYL